MNFKNKVFSKKKNQWPFHISSHKLKKPWDSLGFSYCALLLSTHNGLVSAATVFPMFSVPEDWDLQ